MTVYDERVQAMELRKRMLEEFAKFPMTRIETAGRSPEEVVAFIIGHVGL